MKKLKSILRPLSERFCAWMKKVSLELRKPLCGLKMWQIGAIVAAIILLLLISGCSSVKYVPIQTEERVEIRDSLIYVRDTVTVEIPREIVKEIVPQDTTSILKTSVAVSEARLEQGQLHHTLEQRGFVKTKIDTFYVTKIEEKTVYKDRPVEVEVPVKYVPSFFKFCLWWFIGSLILIALWIVMKFKRF